MIFKQTLHITCWNINGYKVKGHNKYNDPTFLSNICNKDIICLLETHCPFDENIHIPNFSVVNLTRPKNKRTNKISGGLSVLIRTKIKPGVKFLEHTYNDYIWLKVCKDFFGIENDIYICFIYNPPENSTYTQSLQEDLFDLIEKDIVKYSDTGNILLMGDLNARTGNDLDFIQNDYRDNEIPLYDDYTPDLHIMSRLSSDLIVSPRGRALNEMCIQAGIRILNGRCIGDLSGNFTCHNYHGSSVVDYACVSESLFPRVKFFNIHNFMADFSDHCQISLMLNINCVLKPDSKNTFPAPVKYKWSEESPVLFQEALATPILQSKIKFINEKKYENINSMVDDINEVFCKAADISLSKSRNKISHKSTKKLPKWHDLEINNLKKNYYRNRNYSKSLVEILLSAETFSVLLNSIEKLEKRKLDNIMPLW